MLVGKKGPYTIMVQPDEFPSNPRDEDNFGKMVCFHRRYNLGDKHDYVDKDDFLREMYLDTVGNDERGARRYERMLDMVGYRKNVPFGSSAHERAVDEALLKVIQEKYILLPLYLYDHSGISISARSFIGRAHHAEWDSGQVGWVYASKEAALKEFGGTKLTVDKREKAENLMRGEVAYYDTYLRGECYGYELYKDGEEIDSCWGFVGGIEEARTAMEEYMPEACNGITSDLTEQTERASLLGLLKDARAQVAQLSKQLPQPGLEAAAR